MLDIKQGLNFIDTLDLESAGQYTDPLPPGSYLGLMLRFYGTYGSSVDPADAIMHP